VERDVHHHAAGRTGVIRVIRGKDVHLMSAITSLRQAMIEELKDLYHAEQQLIRALPALSRAATDPALRQALDAHLEETRGQVERLERVFELLHEPPAGRPCAGIAGIIAESRAILDVAGERVRDAMIAAAAQRAEHYEIAAYGTVIAWAATMEHGDIVRLLEETLAEERHADAILTTLARARLNHSADAA
jgi:ferritin-like metal-binding protein YciE